MCKVCTTQAFFPWFLWTEAVKQGLRFKHQLCKKFTCLPQESDKILRETEGQGVVVFMFPPLKLHQLSAPVQRVLPRQQGAKPGVETSQV